MKDILFNTDDSIFSYRVGGILVCDNKILLQKPENENYSIIGGHVSFGETTRETLKREFQEELHVEIDVDYLVAVGEIFFNWNNKPCHQIALYYKIHLLNKNQLTLQDKFYDDDIVKGKRTAIDFCWVPLKDLKNITLYPKEIVPIITENSKQLKHFVSRQLE